MDKLSIEDLNTAIASLQKSRKVLPDYILIDGVFIRYDGEWLDVEWNY